jgi:hypothetical protein
MTLKSGIRTTSISRSDAGSLRSLEDFRGDFGEIASLMEKSWAENKNQPLLYTEDFLRTCFEYPGAGFSLAPTIYHGAKPAAFVAGFPRTMRFKDKEYAILVITFLTVANEYKKKGYGVIVWSELVKRARAAGFDGMMNYCLDGEAMNGMILGCCRRLNLPAERIYSVQFLSGLLRPKTTSEAGDSGSVEAFMNLAIPIKDHTPLTRLWSRKEAEWQSARAGAVIARRFVGTRQGLLTGYIMQVANPDRTKCLVVDDIFWGDLAGTEREELVRSFLAKAAAAGARLVIVPVQGYADTQPFSVGRLRPSPRVLHAYFTLWTGSAEIGPLSSFYLDVF